MSSLVFVTWSYMGESTGKHHVCVDNSGVIESACGIKRLPTWANQDFASGLATKKIKQPHSSDMCLSCANKLSAFLKKYDIAKPKLVIPTTKLSKMKPEDFEYSDGEYQEDELFSLLRG